MKREIFLGFDFGTYTTKISFYIPESGEPKMLQVPGLSDDNGFIYSFISENGKIGYDAYKDYKKGNPNVDYGFKMRLNQKEGFEKSKKFLEIVYKKAKEELERKSYIVKGFRFSAPNSWTIEQNEKFLKLLEEIGVIKNYKKQNEIIVREPYAAAVYHILDDIEQAGRKALVIDAGAGTIDTVVIEITPDGKLQEIKNSYGVIEKAGKFVDETIKEFYKMESLNKAEELKFFLSYEFKNNKSEVKKFDLLIKRREFEEECLKDWIKEYRELLKHYKEYNPDYVLFAGGFSAFYLIEQIAREVFPNVQYYPSRKNKPETTTTEFRKDSSISFGCSIIASGKTSIRETLKFDIYLKLESYYEIKKITYEGKAVEFHIEKEQTEYYLIPIFRANDYVGKVVEINKYKLDNKPLNVKTYKTINIIIKYMNTKAEVEKELLIEDPKFIGTTLSNLKFHIDENKILKIIYEYEDGRDKTLTSLDLKTIRG